MLKYRARTTLVGNAAATSLGGTWSSLLPELRHPGLIDSLVDRAKVLDRLRWNEAHYAVKQPRPDCKLNESLPIAALEQLLDYLLPSPPQRPLLCASNTPRHSEQFLPVERQRYPYPAALARRRSERAICTTKPYLWGLDHRVNFSIPAQTPGCPSASSMPGGTPGCKHSRGTGARHTDLQPGDRLFYFTTAADDVELA